VPEQRILMGVVGRPHGVRGLVHLHSYAADPAALPGYGPLTDARGRRFRVRWRSEGVAELFEIIEGKRVPVADRTAAEKLLNTQLFIERDRLPPPEEDEYYLSDLHGLRVVTTDGRELGTVTGLHDHGAGAYLEIGPLLLPFTRACVPGVDIAGGVLTVALPEEVAVAEDRKDSAA
jgi:16S rRNA processing protein RimM